jgi:hypothetical protein
MANSLGMPRCELINCYTATLRAFKVYLVVRCFDFVRMRPKLQEWSDTLLQLKLGNRTLLAVWTESVGNGGGQERGILHER